MKRIPMQGRGLCAPSNLLIDLMARATDNRSDYANGIVAIGIYGKAMAYRLASLLSKQAEAQADKLLAAQQEATDAGARELAAAGDEPAGGAEEVRAA
jgi:hypothetical protein